MKKTVILILVVQMILAMFCTIPIQAQENEAEVYYTDIFEGEAVYLIEDPFPLSASNVPDDKARPSGWDIDYRGGTVANASNGVTLFDLNEKESVSMSRKFLAHKEGKITLETTINVLAETKSGLVIELKGKDAAALKLVTENDKFYIMQSGNTKVLVEKYQPDTDFAIKAILDFDTKKAAIYINGKFCGNYNFSEDCKEINEFFIITPKEDTMDVNLKFVNMHINYLVNERFLTTTEKSIPADWKLEALYDEASYATRVNSTTADDKNAFQMVDTTAIDKAIMRSEFDPQSKKVVGEVKFMIKPQAENVTFSLNSGNDSAIKVYSRRNSFLTTGKREVYEKYLDDFWYVIKIIADVETQTADIYLNYKLKLEDVPFENNVSFIDNVSVETGVAQKAEFFFDDVAVYEKCEKPADYVPEPEPVESEGNDLAMMMYSMWREGNHYGWDRISPYEDRKPYLGYYTEGNTEAADWEIKWLVEHGIDYQVYPWCRQENNLNQPVKNTSRINALHDGFLSAEYSDYMKFALLFSYIYPHTIKNSEDFRKHVVPYWIEYYFKDPRYMIVDNKPIVYIYTWPNLLNIFGSPEGIKAELDYVNEECKKLGFDGVSFVGDISSGYGDWDKVTEYIYNYCWRDKSVSISTMKDSLGAQFANEDFKVVPSIAMGWDNEPWITGVTGDFATPENVGELCEFVRDNFDTLESEGRKVSRNVIFTCWNEYGEGHFYMPSNVHGFDYLNEIRDSFTDAGIKKDEDMPTDRALARLQVMYPPNRSALKILNEPTKMPPEDEIYVAKGWYFDNPEDYAEWSIYKEIDYIRNEDGKLVGHSNNNDPRIANENISIDLTNVVGIRSNCWVEGGGVAMFIYRTEDDPVYGQGKRFDVQLTGDGYTEYFAPPLNAEKVKGTMTGLFFDPDDFLHVDFGDFGLKYIEILARKEPVVQYYLNGNHINPIYPPEKKDGTAFMSALRALEMNGAYVNWNYETKTFVAEKDGKCLEFKDGSNIVLVNGAEKDMGAPAYYNNGHFMVPIYYVCNELGIDVANEAPEKVVTESTVPYHWEFNEDGNIEGWKTSSIGYKRVENGELLLKSSGTDPLIYHMDLSADTTKYKKIKIRMKNLTGATTASLYFLTDSDQTWGGGKRVDAQVSDTKEYVEYTFDMSTNSKWTGKATQIRFDPTSTTGTIYVDYVRMIEETE